MLVDGYVMSWVFVASVALVLSVVITQAGISRRAFVHSELASDTTAADWAATAIAAAGGADPIIHSALAETDDRIARARCSRDDADPVLELELATATRARAAYERTGDATLDVMRALALAREASRLGAEAHARAETLGEWLTRNGGRFVG
jgi:hypothetical protein